MMDTTDNPRAALSARRHASPQATLEARRAVLAARRRAKYAADRETRIPKRRRAWTAEQITRLKAMVEANRQPATIHRERDFPTKTYDQIKGRWQSLKQASLNGGARGGIQHLGLGLGLDAPPSPVQIAERDEREAAENDMGLYADPNHKLLGDPSPYRLAIARELDRRGMGKMGQELSVASWHEDPRHRPFSISAVPAAGPRNRVREHV